MGVTNGCDLYFGHGCGCYGSITGDGVGGYYGRSMVVTPVEGVGVDLAASWRALEVEDICSNRFLLDAMLACSLVCTNQNRIYYYTSMNRINVRACPRGGWLQISQNGLKLLCAIGNALFC